MNLRKLKEWFRRQRGGGHGDEARPTPAPSKAAAPGSPSEPDAPSSGAPAATPVKKAPPVQNRQTVRKPTAKTTGQRPVSRQGIPILKADEDLSAHFQDAPADETPPEPVNGDTDRLSGHSAQSEASSERSSSARPAQPVRRNRLGIRHLDDAADLRDYFMPAADDTSEREKAAPAASARTKPADRDRLRNIPTDRHGIPRLDRQADLRRLFDATVDETEGGEALGETLRQSLAHDARGLMKKKTGGFFPTRRLSLKEKLRRYPDPQAQLDLHGATAARARQRAESFVRTARADGLYTLRIIVGKGLHSEGGAVLPDVIEDLLMDLKRDDTVLSHRWEKRVKRKSGAVIVFLATEFV